MKNLVKIYTLSFLILATISCQDDFSTTPEENASDEFNIEQFSDGYSVAFDVTLDRLGGDYMTRDAADDELEYWENYLDPEEFRILFFDSKDRFLFESTTRWITQIEAQKGQSRWRVGVPIFPYLSDEYDDLGNNDGVSMTESFNWERIAEIMRTEDFKIAILANRPSDIGMPELSDLSAADRTVENFGKNGPFWYPRHSVASYKYPEDNKDIIRTVFDLHHCQYDPFYENKSLGAGNCYDFIMQEDYETTKDGTKKVPHMGAVSCWLNQKRERIVPDNNGAGKPYYFYKLPHGQIGKDAVVDTEIEKTIQEKNPEVDKDQPIPMYGIQKFKALTTWKKGTTYYLSQQTASQTGEYDYKPISLLRSVVKLELRIPWYDNNGKEVKVNNTWAQIFGNNFFARCEPMDVSTPTEEIWNDDHARDCEWNDIHNHGLMAPPNPKDNNYRRQLSWYFGVWKEISDWNFGEFGRNNIEPEKDNEKYPRVFNPITQRLTCAFISDCYLPVEGQYHRWVVYCGERNMNDLNTLNDLYSIGIVCYFRIWVERNGRARIYNIPITNYSNQGNPASNFLTGEMDWTPVNDSEGKYIDGNIKLVHGYADYMNNEATGYVGAAKTTKEANWPYPLLRNHHYRLTVSYVDDEDIINVNVIDGEQRTVDNIFFN